MKSRPMFAALAAVSLLGTLALSSPALAAGKHPTTTQAHKSPSHPVTTTTPPPSVMAVAKNAVSAAAHAAKPHPVSNADLQYAVNAGRIYSVTQYLGQSSSHPHTAVIENIYTKSFTCIVFPNQVAALPYEISCPSEAQSKDQQIVDQSNADTAVLSVAVRANVLADVKHRLPTLSDFQSSARQSKGQVTQVQNSSKAGILKFSTKIGSVSETVCLYAPTKIGGSMAYYGPSGAGPC